MIGMCNINVSSPESDYLIREDDASMINSFSGFRAVRESASWDFWAATSLKRSFTRRPRHFVKQKDSMQRTVTAILQVQTFGQTSVDKSSYRRTGVMVETSKQDCPTNGMWWPGNRLLVADFHDYYQV